MYIMSSGYYLCWRCVCVINRWTIGHLNYDVRGGHWSLVMIIIITILTITELITTTILQVLSVGFIFES